MLYLSYLCNCQECNPQLLYGANHSGISHKKYEQNNKFPITYIIICCLGDSY